MDLASPCVPVGCWVVLIGRRERRGRCFGLERGRPGALSGYALLSGLAGGHSIDSVERGLISNFFRLLVTPGFFIVFKGVNLLVFTLLSSRVVGRPPPIAVLEGVLLLDEPTG